MVGRLRTYYKLRLLFQEEGRFRSHVDKSVAQMRPCFHCHHDMGENPSPSKREHQKFSFPGYVTTTESYSHLFT